MMRAGDEKMKGKDQILEAKKRRLIDPSSTFHKARYVLFVHREGEMATLRGSEVCLEVG